MKTLSPKIIKKLSEDLGLSESTIKKNIYLLAKQYPRATKNALAQIYAQQNGKTVLRMLSRDDRQTLPTTGAPIDADSPKQAGLRVLVQTAKDPGHWYNVWWVQLIIAFLIVGIIAGTISQILGGYFMRLLGITNP